MKKNMCKIKGTIIRSSMLLMLSLVLMTSSIQAATNEESYAGNQLRILGVLKGYEDGSLKLDNPIIRSEVATLAIRLLGYEETEVAGDTRAFSDVMTNYWAYNNIQKAYRLKIIEGYPDLTFNPLGNITYAEVVAIMVNVLGEKDNITGEWPYNYINHAKSLGIIPEDSNEEPSKVITRGEMAVIIWDTLLVKQ